MGPQYSISNTNVDTFLPAGLAFDSHMQFETYCETEKPSFNSQERKGSTKA